MTYYDEQLRQLQEQCRRKQQLDAQIAELRQQRSTLNAHARDLRGTLLSEQADVEKLEGRSLANFFYNVIGKMDERLTKEREEAYGAKVKYDAAARELAAVEEDLQRRTNELSKLLGCEKKYEALLKEKAAAVKQLGSPVSEEILKLEERQAYLSSQETELQEAIAAGNLARSTSHDILSSLDSAHGWGTWDLLGGGLISDVAKHSHLNNAQRSIEQLQSQLRRFKTELADVTIHTDMQANVDGFLRFADYFFDGLFADWAVLKRIDRSKEQVLSTQSQIVTVLSRLQDLLNAVQLEEEQVSRRLKELVLSTQL